MKLRNSLIGLFILCIFLTGCNFFSDSRDNDIRYHKKEHFVRDEIIQALDNQDAAALKSLFSNEALNEIEDIDERIEEYLAFYKGICIEYDSISGSESGMSAVSFDHWYEITTDEGQYEIYFDYIARDEEFEAENKDIVSDKIGLQAIVILNKELADELVYHPWPQQYDIYILYTRDDAGF